MYVVLAAVSMPQTLLDATLSSYRAACRTLGRAEDADMILAEGAFEAARSGDTVESDRIVRAKLMELDERYDNIALAQMSLAGAAEGLWLKPAKVFTSPSCAVDEIRAMLAEKQ